MMMKTYLLLLLTFLSTTTQAAIQNVAIGTIEMILRSSTSGNAASMVDDLLSMTHNFLEATLQNAFSSYNFTSVRLVASSYNVSPAAGEGFVATVDISGSAVFNDNNVPTFAKVVSSVDNAFSTNNNAFLDMLSTGTDPFLTDLKFVVVKVTGNTPELTNSSGTSGGSSNKDVWMIAAVVGACAFICMLLACLACVCLTPDDEEPRPTLAPKGVSASTAEDDGDSVSDVYGTEAHSITSQDSSKFTYNPKSRAYSFDSKSSIDQGQSFQQASFQTQDVEAWQNGSTIKGGATVPFGHDISAIESKKDLSLIEEGDNEDLTPERHRVPPSKAFAKLNIIKLEKEKRRKKKKDTDIDGASKDVIEELNDLSMQISSRRQSVNRR